MEENNNQKTYKDSIFNNNGKYIILVFLCIVATIVLNIAIFTTKPTGDYNEVIFSNLFYTYRLIFAVICGVIIIIGILGVIIIMRNTSFRKFKTSEDRITTFHLGKHEEVMDYSDIEEVYTFRRLDRQIQFPYGTINCGAYRKSKDDSWIVLKYDLFSEKEKYAGTDLINQLIEKHVAYNLGNSRKELLEGKVLRFEYLSGVNNPNRDEFDLALYSLGNGILANKGKNKATKYYSNANKEVIILEKDGLIFKDFKILFEKEDKIVLKRHEVTWPISSKKAYPVGNIIKIIDKNGKLKIEIDLVCLINGQLFFNIVKSFYEDLGNNNISLERGFLDDKEPDEADKKLLKKLAIKYTENTIVRNMPQHEKDNISAESEKVVLEKEKITDEIVEEEVKEIDLVHDEFPKENIIEPDLIEENTDNSDLVQEDIENPDLIKKDDDKSDLIEEDVTGSDLVQEDIEKNIEDESNE